LLTSSSSSVLDAADGVDDGPNSHMFDRGS
jgi:hypothetical protein